MKLFTEQFTKDVLWSILFLLSLYGLINNPYTRPIPQPIPGNWSIQLMQHPLLFGIAGHNYLVIRNQDGEITHELHGLATNPVTGMWKYVGTRDTDVLQVWEFDGPTKYAAEKRLPGIILFEGTKEETNILWDEAVKCKVPINAKHILYPPFGVTINGDTINSNSIAYTLSLCMGAKVNHVGWFTPGSGINLLEKN